MSANLYFRGVGIGLTIAWVTSALAYFKVGTSAYKTLVIFELILSVIFLLIGLLI